MKIKKNENPNSIWNNKAKLILLTIAGSLIYMLPYFRFFFYDTFVESFKLTNTQMGSIGSIYGVFGVVSYIIGGYLADRFSVRNLIVFSSVSTGLGGLILLTYPPFKVLLILQAFWGITTLMTFWPALIKGIRMIGEENEKGKAYGFMEGGRGILNMTLMSIAVAIFGYIAARTGEKFGLSAVILFYSSLDILLGVLVFFIFKDKKTNKSETNEVTQKKFDIKIFKKVITMKYTWMIVAMIFCSYSMNIAYTYFTPYATSQLGSSVVFAAIITVIAQYLRPVSSIGTGLLADKFGSSKIFSIGFMFMGIGIAGALLIPGKEAMVPLFIATVSMCYIAMYSMQSLHFTLLEEGGYSMEVSGMVIGIASTFGYLPEVLIPIVAGRLLDKYPSAIGYKYFFMILLLLAIIGLIVSIVWMRLTKVRRLELKKMNKKTRVEEVA